MFVNQYSDCQTKWRLPVPTEYFISWHILFSFHTMINDYSIGYWNRLLWTLRNSNLCLLGLHTISREQFLDKLSPSNIDYFLFFAFSDFHYLCKHKHLSFETKSQNRRFVAGKGYEKHITDGKPPGKALIVTFMDASSSTPQLEHSQRWLNKSIQVPQLSAKCKYFKHCWQRCQDLSPLAFGHAYCTDG